MYVNIGASIHTYTHTYKHTFTHQIWRCLWAPAQHQVPSCFNTYIHIYEHSRTKYWCFNTYTHTHTYISRTKYDVVFEHQLSILCVCTRIKRLKIVVPETAYRHAYVWVYYVYMYTRMNMHVHQRFQCLEIVVPETTYRHAYVSILCICVYIWTCMFTETQNTSKMLCTCYLNLQFLTVTKAESSIPRP